MLMRANPSRSNLNFYNVHASCIVCATHFQRSIMCVMCVENIAYASAHALFCALEFRNTRIFENDIPNQCRLCHKHGPKFDSRAPKWRNQVILDAYAFFFLALTKNVYVNILYEYIHARTYKIWLAKPVLIATIIIIMIRSALLLCVWVIHKIPLDSMTVRI